MLYMYKYRYILMTFLVSSPFLAYAQGTSAQSLMKNLMAFFNLLIPFMFGMAFLFFVINVFRYFILGGHNEDSQKKAKSLAIYSIAAFVFLVIFYGIVNILTTSLGLERQDMPVPDYRTRDLE